MPSYVNSTKLGNDQQEIKNKMQFSALQIVYKPTVFYKLL